MAILFDPWEVKAVPQDSMPSPNLPADIANGDYIVHFENGKVSYKSSGSGSELPEVTADDNGDVLTVVSGEWAKAAPSGGGGTLVCTADNDGELDHTWQEIHDAGFAVLELPMDENETEIAFASKISVLQQLGGGTLYMVTFVAIADDGTVTALAFGADSADGYPVVQQG